MSTNIKLRRSSVPGKTPSTSQLDLGELAINTHDGKLFIKKDDGAESITELGTQGPTGFTGSQGVQGVTGFTGSKGDQGDTGFTGSIGFTGSRGLEITLTAGSGLVGGGQLNEDRTVSHANTSSQTSVDNDDGNVIQGISLDSFGHVTNINSLDLDSRYLRTFNETDTLDSVVTRGDTTTKDISTGAITSSNLVKSGGIFSNPNTITENHTVVSGDNAISIGDISVATGSTVTVESNATYRVI